jgi:histidyl-tRNA synthetase
MGGGRYDGLVGIMGGPETPGVGWASGVERCMMLLKEEAKARRPIALVPIGEEAEREALILANKIRRAGLPADLGYSGNMGKRMKRANKLNARVAVILGENELAKNVAALRDLDSGEQREVPLETLIESLAQYQ